MRLTWRGRDASCGRAPRRRDVSSRVPAPLPARPVSDRFPRRTCPEARGSFAAQGLGGGAASAVAPAMPCPC